jgi:hypothetical protein
LLLFHLKQRRVGDEYSTKRTTLVFRVSVRLISLVELTTAGSISLADQPFGYGECNRMWILLVCTSLGTTLRHHSFSAVQQTSG